MTQDDTAAHTLLANRTKAKTNSSANQTENKTTNEK